MGEPEKYFLERGKSENFQTFHVPPTKALDSLSSYYVKITHVNSQIITPEIGYYKGVFDI